ncbi:GntR family transcriptional regulator [Sphingomonas crocodyli]|uniref:GntR family transcriptional regulator n=1 Tax=Sphingomonas crocodyli TaxID=1979270 RepID=UPI0013E29C62|nr:GntR family transcriptional regulator [Sphingomonas crocodyli]
MSSLLSGDAKKSDAILWIRLRSSDAGPHRRLIDDRRTKLNVRGKGATAVVQVDRLRDQVYRLIHQDLKVGLLEPGQRLVEGDLAKRYNVSRTPIREALFQLSRDGLLSPAERGYVVAADDVQTTIDRHEVRELIDPRLAAHAATDGTPAQKRALEKAHERQCTAHSAGRLKAFIKANLEFRAALRAMCRNPLLERCSQMLDDQAQPSRRAVFEVEEYRAIEIAHDTKVLEAILAGDAARADAEMRQYVETVRRHLKSVTRPGSHASAPTPREIA